MSARSFVKAACTGYVLGTCIGAVLLVLLTLQGCAGADPDGVVAPGTFVWLPSDSPGYAAQQAWGLGLRANPTIELVSPDEADERCEHTPDKHVLGCFMTWDDGTTSIAIRNDLDEASTASVMLHEIGHAIRPDLPHLVSGCSDANSKSQHVMCADQLFADEPTDADFAWAISE